MRLSCERVTWPRAGVRYVSGDAELSSGRQVRAWSAHGHDHDRNRGRGMGCVVLGLCTASRLQTGGCGATVNCSMLAPVEASPVATASPLNLNAQQLARVRPTDLKARGISRDTYPQNCSTGSLCLGFCEHTIASCHLHPRASTGHAFGLKPSRLPSKLLED